METSGAMIELGIDGNWMLDDTPRFIKACIDACRELGAQLDSSNTQADIITSFKAKATENKSAVEQANEIYDSMVSMISELDPEVTACLLPKLSELLSYGNNVVSTMAMRNAGHKHVSKKIIHAQYRSIKEGYELAMDMLKAFFPEKLLAYKKGKDYIFPTIPAKHGNFRDTSGMKLYKFIIDGVEYFHPFKVAHMLGIPDVVTYMDVTDYIKKNPGKFPNVELEEF